MIDRKMTRSEFIHELMVRVVRRVDVVTASNDEVNRAISECADEMATEIRAHWARLELEARRKNGERVQ